MHKASVSIMNKKHRLFYMFILFKAYMPILQGAPESLVAEYFATRAAQATIFGPEATRYSRPTKTTYAAALQKKRAQIITQHQKLVKENENLSQTFRAMQQIKTAFTLTIYASCFHTPKTYFSKALPGLGSHIFSIYQECRGISRQLCFQRCEAAHPGLRYQRKQVVL